MRLDRAPNVPENLLAVNGRCDQMISRDCFHSAGPNTIKRPESPLGCLNSSAYRAIDHCRPGCVRRRNAADIPLGNIEGYCSTFSLVGRKRVADMRAVGRCRRFALDPTMRV